MEENRELGESKRQWQQQQEEEVGKHVNHVKEEQESRIRKVMQHVPRSDASIAFALDELDAILEAEDEVLPLLDPAVDYTSRYASITTTTTTARSSSSWKWRNWRENKCGEEARVPSGRLSPAISKRVYNYHGVAPMVDWNGCEPSSSSCVLVV